MSSDPGLRAVPASKQVTESDEKARRYMTEVNPWPVGTRLHGMVRDALDALADFSYTGPIPEEHVCDFGEIVSTGDRHDTYRCVLRWSDGTRCNMFVHGQQRVHLWNRYVPSRPEGDVPEKASR
jgi:hypothetical protein